MEEDVRIKVGVGWKGKGGLNLEQDGRRSKD